MRMGTKVFSIEWAPLRDIRSTVYLPSLRSESTLAYLIRLSTHPKAHPPRHLQERRRTGGRHHDLSRKPQADPKPFMWTRSAAQIFEKVARAKQALVSQH